MTDPNPVPKADYGRNVNSPDVLIIGAGISGQLCRPPQDGDHYDY